MRIHLLFGIIVLTMLPLRGIAQIDIEYGRAGAVSLKLDACIPEGPGPFPAMILVHGGGWTQGDKNGGNSTDKPGLGYMLPIQASLTKAGIAYFTINYRLAPKHPYPACIDDVETAIRWVKANAAAYRVDANRLGLSGESAGGHLVALAAVRADETTRVAAVVPFYGVFDFTEGLKRGQKLSGFRARVFGITTVDEKGEALLRSASPLLQVKPGLPPFLLLHGTADKGVPLENSIALQTALQKAGVPCELVRVPGGAHGMYFWDKTNPEYKEQLLEWLKKTL